MIIGFVGFPASGKTEATAIAQSQGFVVVAMGDTVRAYMREQGIALSEKNVGAVANELRARHGMDAIAQMCIPTIRAVQPRKVVIDGIRGIAEVNAYRAAFTDDFKLIAIAASPEARFERAKSRSRADDAVSFRTFEEKDKRELAWGLEEAVTAADFRISNDRSLEAFRSAVSDVIASLSPPTVSVGTEIVVRTPIYATERQDKVERAIRNIFPDVVLKRSNDTITGTSHSLDTFEMLLRVQKIRSAANAELNKRVSSNSFEFILNKQAALVGKVNFWQDPLGPIFVLVATRSPDKVIETITDQSIT
ncbi:MAG TPA: AAA family ATPase [Candidatus Bathyarchaeia archaeon]|nr:AAA family ATPase [Candidatus Bathyarchaeia archaeon]